MTAGFTGLKVWRALLAAVGLACALSAASAAPEPAVLGGHLDLSSYDIGISGPVPLSGEWELYWQRLLTPAALASSRPTPSYYPIPAGWRGGQAGGQPLSEFGVATYRLTVRLPAGTRQIGLRLPYFYGWAKIFLDGAMVRELGEYEPSAPRTSGAESGLYLFHVVQGRELEIVIQSANFSAAEGGTAWEMLIGDADVMARRQASRQGLDGFLISSMLFMAFYHACLFFFRRHESSSIWFAIFSFLIAARLLIVGEGNIASIYFGISSLWAWRLELVTYYLAIPTMAQFMTVIYPQETRRLIVLVSTLVAVPVSMLTLLMPSTTFAYGLGVMQAINIGLVFFYGRAIVAAVRNRRDGARLFLAGFLAIAFLSVGEIVAVNARFNIPRLSPIGMYLFICFQSILLAKRFNAAFVAAETSERDIRRLNAELREQEKTKLELAKVTAERSMLQASLAEAQDVYTSLGVGDGKATGIAMSSFFNPAEVAGGDWLGVHFDKERQRLFLVIGDVTGHDLLSALVTIASAGTFKGAMATIGARFGTASMEDSLVILAEAMNEAVRDSGRQDRRLMSVALLGIDVATGEVGYVNAGHVPALKVSGTDVRPILARANPLGLRDRAELGRIRIKLEPGDGLFLYTDGLLDNEGPQGEKVRMRRLKRILASEADPEQVRARLVAECQAVWQMERPKDDCSFVYIKWQGPPKAARPISVDEKGPARGA